MNVASLIPLCIALMLPALACSNDQGDGTDTAGEVVLEIGACDVEPNCPELCIHLNWGDCSDAPDEAHACGAELLLSGQPGVLRAVEAYGPDPDETERLIVLRGDGTALTQTRSRVSPDAGWTDPGAVEECVVSLPPDLAAACDNDEVGCAWDPGVLEACKDATIAACSEIEAALGG